jgi:myosin heavy subunit
MAMIRFWLTPFQLSAEALATINEAGLQPWPESDAESATPGSDCLLLYDRPDQLIVAASDRAEPGDLLTPPRLLMGYRRLLTWTEQAGQPLMSCSLLTRLGGRGLRHWLAGAERPAPAEARQPAPMDPLVAAAMLRLLEASPELLDAYKDLELRAVLLGAEPDLEYRQQLQQHSQAADPLLTSLATTLRLSRQWPQFQQRLIAEEKDRLAVESAYKHDMASLREQLECQTVELERLRQVHQTALASHQQERDVLQERLDGQRTTLEAELREVRQDYQKIEQRFQHTQDELESFYLVGREKELLLDARSLELEQLRNESLDRQRSHQQELSTALASHQQEIASLRETLELEQRRIQSLESQRANQQELNAALASHQQEIASLRETLELEQRRIHSLESQRANQQDLNAALASHQQEIASLRESLDLNRRQWDADLQLAHQSCEQLDRELQKTKEDLEQSQEELEHYFVQASASRQLLETQHQELIRAQRILAHLYPNPASVPPSGRAVNVEVMPAVEISSSNPSIQTEALLRAYADNLKRAGMLLERMGRR